MDYACPYLLRATQYKPMQCAYTYDESTDNAMGFDFGLIWIRVHVHVHNFQWFRFLFRHFYLHSFCIHSRTPVLLYGLRLHHREMCINWIWSIGDVKPTQEAQVCTTERVQRAHTQFFLSLSLSLAFHSISHYLLLLCSSGWWTMTTKTHSFDDLFGVCYIRYSIPTQTSMI